MADTTLQPVIHADVVALLDAGDLAWALTEPRPGRHFLAPRQLPKRLFTSRLEPTG